jgi:hypothetical protein
MSFPITLIKLITEYVPTPVQLVEHEMQTKGLPSLNVQSRRQSLEHAREDAGGSFPVLYRSKKFQFATIQPIVNYATSDDVPEYVARMRMALNAHVHRHVKMRSDLMAFHLSKV